MQLQCGLIIDTLEFANGIFETGYFASSVPDFTYTNSEVVSVRLSTTATTGDSSALYDLQGHRMETSNIKFQTSKLKKGIYIRDGRKVVVK